LQDQLNITRSKMEAIRRKLEKMRMLRQARKQLQAQQAAHRPYSTAWSLAAAASSSSANNGLRRPPAEESSSSDSFLPPKPEIVTA
jgi:hypothetical protein